MIWRAMMFGPMFRVHHSYARARDLPMPFSSRDLQRVDDA
jgi:hypothetical protein